MCMLSNDEKAIGYYSLLWSSLYRDYVRIIILCLCLMRGLGSKYKFPPELENAVPEVSLRS